MCVWVFALVGQASRQESISSIYAPEGIAVGSQKNQTKNKKKRKTKSTKSVKRRRRQQQQLRPSASRGSNNNQLPICPTEKTIAQTYTNTPLLRRPDPNGVPSSSALKNGVAVLQYQQCGRAAMALSLSPAVSWRFECAPLIAFSLSHFLSLSYSFSITKSQFCYLNVYACVYLLYSVSY